MSINTESKSITLNDPQIKNSKSIEHFMNKYKNLSILELSRKKLIIDAMDLRLYNFVSSAPVTPERIAIRLLIDSLLQES